MNPIEKTPKPYINPILIALEYKKALDSRKYQNQANLANSLNVTHSRVNQYLRLLKLPPEIQEAVVRMGDPLYSRKVTERKLRPIVNLPEEKQVLRLGEMF